MCVCLLCVAVNSSRTHACHPCPPHQHNTTHTQARSQESQLDFAHQQLDIRQQELQAQAAALEAAEVASAQLQDSLRAATEELQRIRQEADAGGLQVWGAGCSELFGMLGSPGQLASLSWSDP